MVGKGGKNRGRRAALPLLVSAMVLLPAGSNAGRGNVDGGFALPGRLNVVESVPEGARIDLLIHDDDLRYGGGEEIRVLIESTSGDSEAVVLREDAPFPYVRLLRIGRPGGGLPLADTIVIGGDGVLSATSGDTLSFSYRSPYDGDITGAMVPVLPADEGDE